MSTFLVSRLSILSVIAFSVAVFTVLPARAADVEITIRTGAVEAINSLKLVDQEVSLINDPSISAALYKIDFSIEAFDADVTVPAVAARGTTAAADLEYVIETREGTLSSGYSAGVILSDTPSVNGVYRIERGDTQTFSMYVVFADTAVLDRADRLQVTGMTLTAGPKVIELNSSEVKELKTKWIELSK